MLKILRWTFEIKREDAALVIKNDWPVGFAAAWLRVNMVFLWSLLVWAELKWNWFLVSGHRPPSYWIYVGCFNTRIHPFSSVFPAVHQYNWCIHVVTMQFGTKKYRFHYSVLEPGYLTQCRTVQPGFSSREVRDFSRRCRVQMGSRASSISYQMYITSCFTMSKNRLRVKLATGLH